MPVYNLIELTSGPWNGAVLRSKEMTAEEADAINAKMSGQVILWMPAESQRKVPEMQTVEITKGTRKVIATRNDESSKWNARLYVNNGETATFSAGKFKTEKGLRAWAEKKLTV